MVCRRAFGRRDEAGPALLTGRATQKREERLASRRRVVNTPGGNVMKSTVAIAALALALSAAGGAQADTHTKKIAFSNNYAGNSWRQAMLKSYDLVTKKAVADGAVAAADVFTTADKEVATQA